MATTISEDNRRLTFLSVVFFLVALAIAMRLFYLQILEHDYYSTMALNSHEIYEKIHPIRGEIFFQSAKDDTEYPAAVNSKEYLLYAVPKEIKREQLADIPIRLQQILFLDDEQKKLIVDKISLANDPYEPLAKRVSEKNMEEIKGFGFAGLYFTPEDRRFYPENNLAAGVLGFYGFDNEGNPKGSYGIEGFWEKDLAGQAGLVLGEKGAQGGWITLAGRTTMEAANGANLVLTIDRALEYQACDRLRQGFEKFKAKSAALVMMDPNTGAVLAMCSFPDFNPNNYSQVNSVGAYNNTAIFTSYEPGSVFKPITMAVGLDLNLVTPHTTFVDPCTKKIEGFTIKNALNMCYGTVSMTQVLENSINTGAMWVEQKIGHDNFKKYVEKFGFGQKTGIGLDTESAGDISSLSKKGDIWGAVGSFGQGFTVTPLQMAAAYSALANGGHLFKPYIVAEKRLTNGKTEKTQPEITEEVISERASKLITGMLVSDVENGHSIHAKLDNYYLAGKTGTAQIAGKGGYLENATNHTFAGFGPINHPLVTLIVKYEQPQSDWADNTAGPVFKDVMKFALEYLGAPKER